MKYECVIWDWNGTLLDDLWLSVDVFNSMMRHCGMDKEVSRGFYLDNFKFPVIKFYEETGFDFKKNDFRKVGEYFIDTYNGRRFECSLHKGIPEMLGELKARGVSQNILSAYRRDYLKDSVEHYEISSFFDNVCGLENIDAVSKEDAGLKLIESLDVARSSVVMIGDTEHDKQVADAMGVDCALVTNGHNSQSRLSKLGAPTFSDNYSLLKWILQ